MSIDTINYQMRRKDIKQITKGHFLVNPSSKLRLRETLKFLLHRESLKRRTGYRIKQNDQIQN